MVNLLSPKIVACYSQNRHTEDQMATKTCNRDFLVLDTVPPHLVDTPHLVDIPRVVATFGLSEKSTIRGTGEFLIFLSDSCF